MNKLYTIKVSTLSVGCSFFIHSQLIMANDYQECLLIQLETAPATATVAELKKG